MKPVTIEEVRKEAKAYEELLRSGFEPAKIVMTLFPGDDQGMDWKVEVQNVPPAGLELTRQFIGYIKQQAQWACSPEAIGKI